MQFAPISLKVRVLTTLTVTLGICFGFVISQLSAYPSSTSSGLGEQASYASFVLGFGSLSLLAVLPALISVVNRMVFVRLARLLEAIESTEHATEVLPRLRVLSKQRDEIGQLASKFLEFLSEEGQVIRAHYQKVELALGHMPQGICIFDHYHRLVLCNPRFEEIHGLEPGRLLPGTPFWRVQELCVEVGAHSKEESARIERDVAMLLRCSQPMYTVEGPQSSRSVSVARVPLPGGGWLATYEDITERKEVEDRLAYMAHHDALTGLANRAALHKEMITKLAKVSQHRMLAVLYLDLDRFKAVNDTLGHAVGDELLKAVSDRLRACVRSADLVSRLGGDEFVVVMSNLAHLEESGKLAGRIVETLGRPFDIAGHQILTGASVGIAVAPISGMNPDELLKAADGALYLSKSGGRGCYQYARHS